MKPLLVTLALLLLPTTALADTTSSDGTDLNGSNSAASSLQSSSPDLQGGASSNSLSAPSDSSTGLQGTTPSSDTVNNYLNGELVGGPQGSGEAPKDTLPSASLIDWIATIVLLLVVGAAGTYYANRERRLMHRSLLRETPSEAQSSKTPLTTELADTIVERSDAEEAEAIEATEVATEEPKRNVKGAGKQAPAKKGKAKGKSGKKKTRKH